MASKDKFKGGIRVYDRRNYLCEYWTISPDGIRELKYIHVHSFKEAKRWLETGHDEYMKNIKQDKNHGN